MSCENKHEFSTASEEEDKPSELVTFIWPRATQTGMVHVLWRSGWTLKRYLHEQPLRSLSLLGMWSRSQKLNAKKQRIRRLSYIPTPNDVIVFRG